MGIDASHSTKTSGFGSIKVRNFWHAQKLPDRSPRDFPREATGCGANRGGVADVSCVLRQRPLRRIL